MAEGLALYRIRNHLDIVAGISRSDGGFRGFVALLTGIISVTAFDGDGIGIARVKTQGDTQILGMVVRIVEIGSHTVYIAFQNVVTFFVCSEPVAVLCSQTEADRIELPLPFLKVKDRSFRIQNVTGAIFILHAPPNAIDTGIVKHIITRQLITGICRQLHLIVRSHTVFGGIHHVEVHTVDGTGVNRDDGNIAIGHDEGIDVIVMDFKLGNITEFIFPAIENLAFQRCIFKNQFDLGTGRSTVHGTAVEVGLTTGDPKNVPVDFYRLPQVEVQHHGIVLAPFHADRIHSDTVHGKGDILLGQIFQCAIITGPDTYTEPVRTYGHVAVEIRTGVIIVIKADNVILVLVAILTEGNHIPVVPGQLHLMGAIALVVAAEFQGQGLDAFLFVDSLNLQITVGHGYNRRCFLSAVDDVTKANTGIGQLLPVFEGTVGNFRRDDGQYITHRCGGYRFALVIESFTVIYGDFVFFHSLHSLGDQHPPFLLALIAHTGDADVAHVGNVAGEGCGTEAMAVLCLNTNTYLVAVPGFKHVAGDKIGVSRHIVPLNTVMEGGHAPGQRNLIAHGHDIDCIGNGGKIGFSAHNRNPYRNSDIAQHCVLKRYLDADILSRHGKDQSVRKTGICHRRFERPVVNSLIPVAGMSNRDLLASLCTGDQLTVCVKGHRMVGDDGIRGLLHRLNGLDFNGGGIVITIFAKVHRIEPAVTGVVNPNMAFHIDLYHGILSGPPKDEGIFLNFSGGLVVDSG